MQAHFRSNILPFPTCKSNKRRTDIWIYSGTSLFKYINNLEIVDFQQDWSTCCLNNEKS